MESLPEKKPQTFKNIGLIAGVIGGIVGGLFGSKIGREAVHKLMGGSPAAIDHQLSAAASEMNKNLPQVIDKNTRLDSTFALPGKKLGYAYTVYGIDPIPNAEQIETMMKPQAINNYRTAAEMKGLRDADVILVYKYKDEEGNELGQFEISTDDF